MVEIQCQMCWLQDKKAKAVGRKGNRECPHGLWALAWNRVQARMLKGTVGSTSGEERGNRAGHTKTAMRVLCAVLPSREERVGAAAAQET